MFCFACSFASSAGFVGDQCPKCGAEAVVRPPPATARRKPAAPSGPAPAVLVRSVDAAAKMVVEPVEGELAAALGGGVLRGATILVSGPQGAGKSTISAEFVDSLRRHRGGLSWWLDRDQMQDSLVAALFQR